MTRSHPDPGMRLSTKLVISFTVIVLIVVLIGIYATYTTFTLIFSHLELWGEVVAKICFGAIVFFVCSGTFLALFFCITEIQIRRLRLVRYAPTPEGYYEALQTEDGFLKPEDNVILQVPHTASQHITNPKPEVIESQSDDATVIELYEQGLTLRTIAQSTNRSYYQIQKITSQWKEKHG